MAMRGPKTESTRPTPWRYLWAAPATAVGLTLAALAWAFGATARGVDGVLEVAGGALARWVCSAPAPFGFVAITLGHVVLGQSHAVLARLRPHEHAHVRQYERWGPLFFLLYLGASGAELLRGNRPYWHNRFEREARAVHAEALAQTASGAADGSQRRT